ncbi:MAG: HAMP domain-containing protein [Deltaproteobacteria bacterium]|nr:HAMP domain-containing protein [Deltaproteobacteria bacterium]
MSNNKETKKFGLLYSIRTKFMAMIIIFVAVLMLTVIGLINRTVGEIVLDQGLEKGLAVARGVAAASDDPLLTDDDLALFTVIKGVIENKGVAYGMVIGKDNFIKAHSDVSESGRKYIDLPESNAFKEGNGYKIKFYKDPKLGYIYDIAVPVTSARVREGMGFVHIGISQHIIDEAVERVNRYIKYLTIAGLVLGGLGAVLITNIIVRPVQSLVKSARELGAGNLDYRINVDRRDELGSLMLAFNDMAEGLKQKEVIRESFGRYVASEVLDMILTNKETWFKGRKITVTILFADIRGFTSFSERTDPETLINVLNEYFTLMTEVIQKHRGYVDKFIGDCIMVVFGSPVHFDDHAIHAAKAACEMQEKLRGFNRSRPAQSQIAIGIGVNTGEVVAGNLGSFQKMEYAVIGDNVNVASRLCSAAKKGEAIISKSCYEEIKGNEFKTEELAPITVKGKAEPLNIYSLLARRSPDRLEDGAAAVAKRGTGKA